MPLNKDRHGPWALILGGSEGIGVSFARQLALAGMHCILVARQADLLRQAADHLQADFGVQTRTLAIDLTRPDMLDRLREVTDDLEVGLVVYNAAAVPGGGGRFLECPVDVAQHVVRLLPVGQVSVAHHFGGRMAARGRGGIILIGSLAGNAGGVVLASYSASKAFTQLFAEALWAELKPLGIDVLCYVVGATYTPSRARLRLTDRPGDIVSEPDDIARGALENIDNGPVQVPEHLRESFQQLSSMPRREAVQAMNAQLQEMSVGKSS
jgi:short-subunit dehydrogenase